MSSPVSFVSELRRRHVFRVAGLYIVAAWVVLQVSDLAFESWGLPAGALRYVWIAALVLFPIALVFGWLYDITASGIVRTPPSTGAEDLSLKPLDIGVLAVLLAATLASGWWLVEKISESSSGIVVEQIETDMHPFSIAVLPFTTRSRTEDTAFFADGMHDDLLTSLSKVVALKVISRTSVLEYRDTEKNIRRIGRELGAAFVMEGGVQQAGDNVRINVQLIDSRTDGHVWANTYDRALTVENLFAIQSELVEDIAEHLQAALTPAERRAINKDRTDNLEAFREYTYGRQQMDLSSFEALRKAAGHFRAAIALDPEYVLAHAALANAFAQLALVGSISPDEARAEGQPHIERALELDPDNAYAQAVYGRYLSIMGDPRADEVLRSAVAAAPNDVDVLNIYAIFLRTERRGEEALVILDRALDLDPLSVMLYHDLGRVHLWMGQFDLGLQAFERISQINPGNPYAAHGSGIATILAGHVVEAAHWSDEAAAIDPNDYENPATSAMLYGAYGDFDTAWRRVEEALALGPEEPYPLAAEALTLFETGELAKATAVSRTALAMDLEDRWGSHAIFLRLVRDDALRSGAYDEALTWYRKYEPALFASPPRIDANNMVKAPDLALLLRAAGLEEQATELLRATVEAYTAQYTLGSANYPLGIAVVDALVLLGRDDEAITRFRELVDDGWRMSWRFRTQLNRNLDSIRDNPDFQSIVGEVAADIERQRRESTRTPR